MADIIQANYDELARIAREFAAEADAAANLHGKIAGMVNELEGGGWVGRGADAFYDEMYDEVMPALDRLINALDDAGRAVTTISDIVRNAEVEASQLFAGGNVLGGTGRFGVPGSAGGVVGSGFRQPEPVGRRGFGYRMRQGTQHQRYWGMRAGPMTFDDALDYAFADPFKPQPSDFVKAKAILWSRDNFDQTIYGVEGHTTLGSWGNLHGSLLSTEVDRGLSLQFDQYGLTGKGEYRVGGYLGKVEADAHVAGFDATVEGYLGAEANAEGRVSFNPFNGDLGAKGELGAFAGVKAVGEVSRDFGPVKLGLEGGVSAGAGAEAAGEIGMDDRVFRMDANAGVTWGVGGEVGGFVEVDLREAATNVVTGAQEAFQFLQGQAVAQ